LTAHSDSDITESDIREPVDSFLPLSAAALHILLSLAGEERHGYGIMQDVAAQTDGKYKLGPGTLYDNLQKLMDHGFVEQARGARRGEDPRRRYYRLTGLGAAVLSADVARLERVVQKARLHLRAGKRGEAT